MRSPSVPLRLLVTSLLVVGVGGAAVAAAAPPAPSTPATPGIACGPGSKPETGLQGRAPKSDLASGRYAQGYDCNVTEVSHVGATGGYRVERYVDAAGHECAFYDSQLLWPTFVADQGATGPGTYVLDMADPAKPVLTDVLRTPAMQTPHESLRLNSKRGLLVAVMGYPTAMPGQIDVYDVRSDCRHPQLLASAPVGVLGHEGGFAPDGLTYYAASLSFDTLTAIDLSEPRAPRPVWTSTDYQPHGVSVSEDGRTLFVTEAGNNSFEGLTVLDVSQVQERATNPQVPVISRTTWDKVSTPQNATPFTSKGKRYVLETDEFGEGADIGAARILDVQDITKPKVVSDLRLEVNRAEHQADLQGDPGNNQPFQGYQAHYCTLPSRVDPQIVACSFIMSGLRVFDISDVRKPREIAYHSRPVVPGSATFSPSRAGAFAMSAPAYDEASGDIWYTDGISGFYVVRLTGKAARPRFAKSTVLPGN